MKTRRSDDVSFIDITKDNNNLILVLLLTILWGESNSIYSQRSRKTERGVRASQFYSPFALSHSLTNSLGTPIGHGNCSTRKSFTLSQSFNFWHWRIIHKSLFLRYWQEHHFSQHLPRGNEATTCLGIDKIYFPPFSHTHLMMIGIFYLTATGLV